jgi:hypothetical protein
MSAERLAVFCGDWESVNPGGTPPEDSDVLNVSPQQIARSMACEAYIFGVLDGRLEGRFGAHYHPVPSRPSYLKTLIDTFLKYSKDHPEEEGLAASTMLGKVQALIINAESPDKQK